MQNEELLNALKAANEICRSAYQIAVRSGRDTKWDAFIGQLEKQLDAQHKILYPNENRP